jgi:hypothetical protein
MESSTRASKEASNKNPWLWWLLTGLALGIVGTIFIPDFVRPYLPAFMRGENVEISGIVEAKSREADRLLLTIAGSSGAVLVTYTQQIAEMDLLIEPGDSVVLAVREYAPFVEDPSVRRVQKKSSIQRRPGPSAAEQEANQPEAERRAKTPADEVLDLEPMRDEREGEFYREIGPEDSTAAAVEGEAVPADDPEAETPTPEEQEQSRK